MNILLSHESPAQVDGDWLIASIGEEAGFPPAVVALDSALTGALTRLREQGDLSGKLGDIVELRDVPGLKAKRLAIVGLGTTDQITPARLDQALMTVVRRVSTKPLTRVGIVLPELAVTALGRTKTAEQLATALIVGSTGQGIYRGEKDRHAFPEVVVLDGDAATAKVTRAGIDRGTILGHAINLTRELVNRHPHDLVPTTFAQRAQEEAAAVGLSCEVFDVARLQSERMGSLLAVARGSALEPRVVVLNYRGAGADEPLLGLCGKGVTFDSGGLSLKPSDSMKTMKGDMAGAATVLGTMVALAKLKVPVNVIGVLGLVENMPSSTSYKLGEVLTARNGVTIEVHNTDAEGRLVLADVLSYTVDQGAEKLIDLATLTGSCVVALGEEVAGVFANDQTWCDQFISAARDVGEEVWQLPMYESFNDQLKCDVADVKNVGTRWGGAITAAKFLERFVSGKPWIHLDIAGPAFCESSKPHREGGGTGAMLRGLVELAQRQGR